MMQPQASVVGYSKTPLHVGKNRYICYILWEVFTN